jgi:hypothetical protein
MFLIDIIGINIYTHQHDRFEVGFKLPVQLVVSSNPVHGEIFLSTTLCDKICQWLATGW